MTIEVKAASSSQQLMTEENSSVSSAWERASDAYNVIHASLLSLDMSIDKIQRSNEQVTSPRRLRLKILLLIFFLAIAILIVCHLN